MSDSKSGEAAANAKSEVVAEVVESMSPTKRTPKRKADAFQKESEELLKNLGVTVDMEDGGRRRTRSSARGVTATPPTTPATPPAKRARGSLNTPKRGSKLANKQEDEESDEEVTKTATPKKRGSAGPKKLIDVAEEEPPKQDAEVEQNDTVTATKADDSTEAKMVVEETKLPKSPSKESHKEDKVDGAAETNRTDKPEDTEKVVDEKPVETKKTEDSVLEKDSPAKEEKKAEVGGSVGAGKSDDDKQVEEPMEVDGAPAAAKPSLDNDTVVETKMANSDTVEEAKPVENDAVQATQVVENTPNAVEAEQKTSKEEVTGAPAKAAEEAKAETVESNENGDSAASATQQANSPEKKVESKKEGTVVNVVDTGNPSAAGEDSSKKESLESTTLEETDKTAPSNNVPTQKSDTKPEPTPNKVAEPVNSNVESKLVVNSDPAAVEPATAP